MQGFVSIHFYALLGVLFLHSLLTFADQFVYFYAILQSLAVLPDATTPLLPLVADEEMRKNLIDEYI